MADDVPPELTSDPTREDVSLLLSRRPIHLKYLQVALCADAIAKLIAAGEKDTELLASEYLRGATLYSSLVRAQHCRRRFPGPMMSVCAHSFRAT